MLNRRGFVGGIMATLGLAQAKAAPKKSSRDFCCVQSLQGPHDPDYRIPFKIVPPSQVVPWTLETEDLSVYHSATASARYPAEAVAKVKLHYRGNLFCSLALPVWDSHAELDPICASLRKLREVPYTPENVYRLYSIDVVLHQLFYVVAEQARQEKLFRDWPFDDTISFRGDAIGSILYDIIRLGDCYCLR